MRAQAKFNALSFRAWKPVFAKGVLMSSGYLVLILALLTAVYLDWLLIRRRKPHAHILTWARLANFFTWIKNYKFELFIITLWTVWAGHLYFIFYKHISFWSLIPTLLALAGTLLLFVAAHRQRWVDVPVTETTPHVEKEAETHVNRQTLKQRLTFYVSQFRWEILLAGVVTMLAAYFLIFAPAQMAGGIPINPMEPGRPFYFLHWQRGSLNFLYYEAAIASTVLTGLLALSIVILALVRRSPSRIKTALLWTSLSLATCAQWCLGREPEHRMGIELYLAAALGFFIWAQLAKQQIVFSLNQPIYVKRGLEITLVVAVIALASFGRLFELDSIPYGIEGDEAKWTGEVVWLGIRGLPDYSGLYHRDALPVSFFMQTPFHQLLGPSIFSARFEVAFFSILATFLFYLLLRRLTNIPLALLSAWLLSASIFDISASRLANVESHVKLWPILTLLLLASAIRARRWHLYAVSGIALALGLLTYDTVWPLLLAAVIICMIEINRQDVTRTEKARFVTALLAPSIFALPILLPYLASRLGYYDFNAKGWEEGFSTLWLYFSKVLKSWYIYANVDFLYNRMGPLVNAFLLPWITMGFFASLATLRQRFSYWTLIWLAVFIFPVPIAAHSPLGRVYYPGLPAVYALAALGLFLFAYDSLSFIGKILQPLSVTIALVVLIWLPLMNLYIYFNETGDEQNRQVRREIGEIAGSAADMDTLIVLPNIPYGNEPLNNEYQMIELFMLAKIPTEEIQNSYQYVALDDLMPALPDDLTDRPNLEIILDKVTDSDRIKRDEIAQTLKHCYPKGILIEGIFFDRFSLPASALAEPACLSANLTLHQTSSSQQLSWELSKSTVTSLSLQCGVQTTEHVWLEAETLPPPSGWQADTAFVQGWNASGYLADNYLSEPVLYEFETSTAGQIYIWARTLKREADHSPLQLQVNGQAGTVSQTVEDNLNKWIWERVGPFDISENKNTLIITRPYMDDPSGFMAIFLDTLVFTPDVNLMPEQNYYAPIPAQHFLFPGGQSAGQITLDLEPGIYQCQVSVDGEQNLVDNLGHAPVMSNFVVIEIKP